MTTLAGCAWHTIRAHMAGPSMLDSTVDADYRLYVYIIDIDHRLYRLYI